MKIREYKIIHNNLKQPKLWEAHVYNYNKDKLESYDDIVDMMNKCFKMNVLNEEYCYILAFNWGLDLLGVFEYTHGSTKETNDYERRIACLFLLISGADQYIIVHNHPNGLLEISDGDFKVTKNIEDSLSILDFNMNESIIISSKGYKLIKQTIIDNMMKSLPKFT